MKNQQLIIIAFFIILNGVLKAQSMDEILIPGKEVTKIAKKTVKQAIFELKDSLNLTRKGMRIRDFELVPCNQPNWINSKYGKLSAEFVGTRDSCYFFQHRTNYQGSYYTIDFILDLNGELVEQEVNWFMVTH